MADNNKYRSLNFNHSEINDLLKKIKEGFVFSEAEYKKLIEEIGLDNISTFDGDYEKLINQPVIPVKVSELANDANFQNGEIVDGKIANAIKQVEKLLEPKLDEEDMAELQEAINKINADMSLKMDKEAGKGLMNVDEIARLAEVKNYDDAELRQMIEAKANKEDLFNKDYNELINKPEIPSIQGLATEMYVDEKITDLIDFAPDAMNTLKELANAIEEHQDIYEAHVQGQAELLNAKVDKQEGFGLMDEAEMARLAEVDNYNDEELRVLIEEKANKDELFNKDYNELMNLPEIPSIEGLANEDFVKAEDEKLKDEIEELRQKIDEQEPFLADVAAYPTSKFLFACGQAMTVDVNKDKKYDPEAEEDAVVFIYRWADGFKCISLDPEVAAKTYLVGGYGHDNVNVKRPIPQTNMLVKNVKIKGLVGGSYFEGMVGHVNIEAINCEFTNVIGGGWCGAAVNGEVTRMNIADDINIKLDNVKGLNLVFGGPQGNGVANKVNMELNNCEAGWVTAGGSNGMTREARIVMNGGKAKVVQSTNRGIVHKAEFVLNDGVVDNLYFGGETEDKTVNGLIEEGFVRLNGGEVKKFNFGTNNGIELVAEDIKGTIANCAIADGDFSMLEKIEMPADPQVGDCVFNVQLNKPVWFNGKNWVDANGSIVG